MADFYLILFNAALEKRENIPHGREGFYYSENGEHTWYDLCKTIARELHAKGASKTDEPTTFTDEELIKAIGNLVSTSRVHALRKMCSLPVGNAGWGKSRAWVKRAGAWRAGSGIGVEAQVHD